MTEKTIEKVEPEPIVEPQEVQQEIHEEQEELQ